MKESIGDELKEARAKLGVSQAEISKTLGVPLKTWVNWEQGLSSPVSWARRLLMKELQRMIDKKK